MTTVSKQREEELLSQVEDLQRRNAERDSKIKDQDTQLIQLQFQIKERDIAIMSHGMTI